jgi:hypothetical protein
MAATYKAVFVLALTCSPLLIALAQKPNSADPSAVLRPLTPQQVAAFETRVTADPDDLEARSALLSFYFLHEMRQSPEVALKKAEPHYAWFVEHQPQSPLAMFPMGQFAATADPQWYAQTKQLWIKQTELHSDNPEMLNNAAMFLMLSDRARAEDLLKRVLQLQPGDTAASTLLGQLYAADANSTKANPNDQTADKQKALEAQESALQNADEQNRFYGLDAVAMTAFEAGDIGKAETYANELLKLAARYRESWNYGNAIHKGNIVLGRIRLRQGDLEKAKSYLLSAGATPGSPQLNSFGPNMTLAKELLEKGERDVVLHYFDLCRKFWKLPEDRLDVWTADVKAGKIPDFGGNLKY